ncbi:hypothetical protein EPN90_02630 [Patescibacteria group bacterium]|nr:MAG: hypothetical protein EPN90_02630 [Patescibacteria group bacterium]
MKKAGALQLRRKSGKVILTVFCKNLAAGLGVKPGFGLRTLHFGTKLRGYNIQKGQGYGWDGRDYIRAKRKGKNFWVMTIPIRDNDRRRSARRFIKGNCYIRTHHNEIYYFDLSKWVIDPSKANVSDRHGGRIIEIDFEKNSISNSREWWNSLKYYS